jgi:hypothetical protein
MGRNPRRHARRQPLSLSIGQLHPSSLELVAQDAVFRCQIRIAQAEFLINGFPDGRQQWLPIHVSFHPSHGLSVMVRMGHTEAECKIRG